MGAWLTLKRNNSKASGEAETLWGQKELGRAEKFYPSDKLEVWLHHCEGPPSLLAAAAPLCLLTHSIPALKLVSSKLMGCTGDMSQRGLGTLLQGRHWGSAHSYCLPQDMLLHCWLIKHLSQALSSFSCAAASCNHDAISAAQTLPCFIKQELHSLGREGTNSLPKPLPSCIFPPFLLPIA